MVQRILFLFYINWFQLIYPPVRRYDMRVKTCPILIKLVALCDFNCCTGIIFSASVKSIGRVSIITERYHLSFYRRTARPSIYQTLAAHIDKSGRWNSFCLSLLFLCKSFPSCQFYFPRTMSVQIVDDRDPAISYNVQHWGLESQAGAFEGTTNFCNIVGGTATYQFNGM